MPLCQVCRNLADVQNVKRSGRPKLNEGERCSRCSRTPEMEREDLEVEQSEL